MLGSAAAGAWQSSGRHQQGTAPFVTLCRDARPITPKWRAVRNDTPRLRPGSPHPRAVAQPRIVIRGLPAAPWHAATPK